MFVCLGSRMRGVPQHVLYVFVCLGSRMLNDFSTYVLYVFVCLGFPMRWGSWTCILLYPCLFRFSNARGFLDIVLYVFVCLGSRMLMDFSTCIVCVCLLWVLECEGVPRHVLYEFVCCRFSNARGFLDMYCMCLSV